MKTWLVRLAMFSAALLAAAGLWSAAAADPPSTLQEQTREVAETLRCPTCVGEDVADSAAPFAAAMRQVIAQQLDQGRSPGQIRSWFVQRYGDEVLLDPARKETGWLLWGVPLVVIGAAVLVLGRRGSARSRWFAAGASAAVVVAVAVSWEAMDRDRTAPLTDPATPLNMAGVLEQAVVEHPGDVELQLALGRALDEEGRSADAIEHYAAALRLQPFEADIAYLHAAALTRSGATKEAMRALDEALALQADHAPSLLLAGTLLLRAGEERGTELLERFLELEPKHPAAPDVRALLTGTPLSGEASPASPKMATIPAVEEER